MAEGGECEDLQETLSHPQYNNWVKGVLLLKLLKEGLEEFLEEKIKTVQATLLAKVFNLLPPGTQTVPSCTSCTGERLQKRNPPPCPTTICPVLLQEITQIHLYKQPNLDNTDVKAWNKPEQSWEIAKCFLGGKGYGQVTHARETDCTGLLSVLMNCVSLHPHFQEDMTQQNNVCQQVKDIRNAVMHSADLSLEDSRLKVLIQCCMKLLSEVNSSKALEVVEKIKQLEDAPLTVSSLDYAALIKEVTQELRQEMETTRVDHSEQLETLKQRVEELERREHGPSSSDEDGLRQRLLQKYHRDLAAVQLAQWSRSVNVLDIVAPLVIREDLEQWLTTDVRTRKPLLHEEGKSGERKTIESYQDIFYRNETLQHEIYLLGEAGVGKSTFCLQLVNLWCKLQTSEAETEYENFLQKIKYVFHVRCRDAKSSESVLDMILQQIVPKKYTKLVENLFMTCPEKCLVLVDGLDEWARPSGRSSLGLPDIEDVYGSFVLITSRPWRIEALEHSPRHFCRVLEIQGLDENGVRTLSLKLLKELGEKNREFVFWKFESQIKQQLMTEIIKLTLMLTMILIAWYKGNQSLKRSVCLNYSDLIEQAIKHSEQKIEQKHTSFDKTSRQQLPACFVEKKLCLKYGLLIEKLSALAFNTLFCEDKAESLVFDKESFVGEFGEEDLQICLDLGLLSQSEALSESIISRVGISFLHKSLQEFLAAVYFCGSSFDECFRRFCRNVITLTDMFDYKSVVVFLCGLSPVKGQSVCTYITDLAGQSEIFTGYRRCSHIRVFHSSISDDMDYYTCLRNVKLLQEMLLQCNSEAESLTATVLVPGSESSVSQQTSVMSGPGTGTVQLKYSVPDVVIVEKTDAGTTHLLCSQGENVKSLSFYDGMLSIVNTPMNVVKCLPQMDQLEKLCLGVPLARAEEYIECTCRSIISLRYLKTFSLSVSGDSQYRLSRYQCEVLLKTLHQLPALISVHLQRLNMSEVNNIRLPQQLISLSLDNVSISGNLTSLSLHLSSMSLYDVYISGTVEPLSTNVSSLSLLDLSLSLGREMSVSDKIVSAGLPSRLTSLYMYVYTFSLSGRQQLCQYLKSTSSLQTLSLSGVLPHVSILDDVLDLRQHQSLYKLKLEWLDLKSGLLLSKSSSLTQLVMYVVKMSAESWNCLIQNLTRPQSHQLRVELFLCSTINDDTRSYLHDNFTVTQDIEVCIVFHTNTEPARH